MKIFLSINLVLLGTLILTGCGQQEVTQIQPIITDTATQTQEQLVVTPIGTTTQYDNIDNWQNYKNDKYGVEFKYPSEGNVKLRDTNDACIDLTLGTITLSILNSANCSPSMTGLGMDTEIINLPGESIIINEQIYTIGMYEYITNNESEKRDSIVGDLQISDTVGISYNYNPKDIGMIKQILSTLKFTK